MAIVGYKISDGKSVTFTSSGAKTGGTWYKQNGFLGLLFADVADGEVGALNIECAEYKTDQIDTGDTMTIGTKIYWDNGNSRFTEDGESGFPFVGIVTKTKNANNVIYFILVSQGEGLDAIQATNQADSTASDVAGIVADFNTLLGKLQTAGLMASS